MLAISAVTDKFNAHVKAFKSDLDHDIRILGQYPYRKFLYLLRDHGSHIIIFDKIFNHNGRIADIFTDVLLAANTRYFFWNGKKLVEKTREESRSILGKNSIEMIGA
jgi:hypothetical protein